MTRNFAEKPIRERMTAKILAFRGADERARANASCKKAAPAHTLRRTKRRADFLVNIVLSFGFQSKVSDQTWPQACCARTQISAD
jgi:hypothetical protein